MPRTTVLGIFRPGLGYVTIDHRDMLAGDAVLVASRRSDRVHGTRFSPPVAACDATAYRVNRAVVTRDQLVGRATRGALAASAARLGLHASRHENGMPARPSMLDSVTEFPGRGPN
jgi:UDP-N-acetylmuramyl tripeptide synthase